MACWQPSTPFEKEVLNNQSNDIDLIWGIANALNCSPFDPIIKTLTTTQIRWIFESVKKQHPEVDKEKAEHFSSSMEEWQKVLSPDEFRKKLYKGQVPQFIKNLETIQKDPNA